MTKKEFYKYSAIIFFVAAMLHLWRTIGGHDLMIGTYVIPVWVSWAVIIIAGYMSIQGFKFSNK